MYFLQLLIIAHQGKRIFLPDEALDLRTKSASSQSADGPLDVCEDDKCIALAKTKAFRVHRVVYQFEHPSDAHGIHSWPIMFAAKQPAERRAEIASLAADIAKLGMTHADMTSATNQVTGLVPQVYTGTTDALARP